MDCMDSHAIELYCLPPNGDEEFSTSPYGCLVIQKVQAFCNNPHICHTLVFEMTKVVVKLSSDPYGNYVVQHVVEYGAPIERFVIMKNFQGHVLRMSYQKYSSNIIEKFFMFGGFQDCQLITTEILNSKGDGQNFDHLLEMMCHPDTNYVIKNLVMVADEGQLHLLEKVDVQNLAAVMRYPQGRQVITLNRKVLTERGIASATGTAKPQALPGPSYNF